MAINALPKVFALFEKTSNSTTACMIRACKCPLNSMSLAMTRLKLIGCIPHTVIMFIASHY